MPLYHNRCLSSVSLCRCMYIWVLDHKHYVCKWLTCELGWNLQQSTECTFKKNSRAHSRSLLGNEWIQSPDTIRPISYIIFSLSFTIHQLSLRLIYEAYFIFREFSDDRKLISSALVLLLTVAQSRSGQSWNCFNILSVSACCWHKTLYYNSTVEGLTNKEKQKSS